jgi:hypothetical protein
VESAGSVKGSVNYFYFPGFFLDKLGPEKTALYHIVVKFVYLFIYDYQKPLFQGFLTAHFLNIRNRVYLGYDPLVVGRDNLAASCPIGLVAVVLGRVVARGNHYACIAVKMPDGEGKFRRGAHL